MVEPPTAVLPDAPEEEQPFNTLNNLVRIFFLAIILCSPGNLCAQSVNDNSGHGLPPRDLRGQIILLHVGVTRNLSTAPDSAVALATRALHLAREIDSKVDVIQSEYLLGRAYALQKNDTVRGFRHLATGLELAKVLEYDSLVIKGALWLARCNLAAEAPRRSISYLNMAVNLIGEGKDQTSAADVFTTMADAYKALGVYHTATDFYLKAARIADAEKNEVRSAGIFNSIGTVYMRTGDHTDALEYFDRALRIYETHSDTAGVVGTLLNTGVIYQKQEKLQEALDVFLHVLPRIRDLRDVEKESVVTGNIGSTLASMGRLEEGLSYLEKALSLKESSGNIKRSLHTLNDIANVRIQLGDGIGAREAAEKVLRLAPQYEGWDQLLWGYLNLSRSYKLLGDFRNAYHFLEKHHALNDSLFGIQKAQQINELQIRYDTERKDMAIHSLQQEKLIATAQRNNYILGAAVLLLIVGALYISQRLKAKRHRELLEKEREVDRLKSDFFANISHEFRTPLSLILGPLNTMLAKTSEAGQRFQLELMKKSAARLLRLINQILELSRLQFSRPVLKAMQIDVVEVVRGVAATFQSMADARGIVLEFETDPAEINLFCDPEQIETVCINLISNAFKFTDTGGTISVALRCADADQRYPQGAMELEVKDNGIGIPQEQVVHIFDRFYRAGSASEKQYGGTGIGLALTRELVELHHGTIGVQSVLGKGTGVTVRLPLGKGHLREDQIVDREDNRRAVVSARPVTSEVSVNGSPAADPGESDKPLVLLMDDNADVRSYIRLILEEKYLLLEAPNGEEGVRIAKAFIPDLIISDVMMPVMDGYEASRQLKKSEKTSHIPVILLTARASVNSRIEGLETEADLYLSKPFVPQELLLCIHNLVQSRRKLRERYNRHMVLKPADIAINSTDELFLQRLMKILEANYSDESFGVEELSSEIGMSRSQLHRKLQALTNDSTSQFIRAFRLQRAMELLKKNHASIAEIAFKVGFSSAPYFNRCFLQHYGCTPSSVIERSGSVPAGA